MKLFDDKVRTALGYAANSETLIGYLDRSGRLAAARLRNLLEDWFAHYPAEHRPHLRGQLFSRIATKERSAWWELYLHESFLRAGYQVQVSSGTPDFKINGRGGSFYVEATARFEDGSAIAQERRVQALHDALDRTRCDRWRLGMEILSAGPGSAPARKFRLAIEHWLTTLDLAAAERAKSQESRSDFERYPRQVFSYDDWEIEIEALPYGIVGGADDRAIICSGHTEMLEVKNTKPLREALAKKASECRRLPLDSPLILAILLARDHGREDQRVNALFGDDTLNVDLNLDTLQLGAMKAVRLPNGFWSPAPASGDRSVAGILAGVCLDSVNFATVAPTFWTSPFHQRAPLGIADVLPWNHRWIDEEGRLQRRDKANLALFWGLDRGWLGDD